MKGVVEISGSIVRSANSSRPKPASGYIFLHCVQFQCALRVMRGGVVEEDEEARKRKPCDVSCPPVNRKWLPLIDDSRLIGQQSFLGTKKL